MREAKLYISLAEKDIQRPLSSLWVNWKFRVELFYSGPLAFNYFYSDS